MANNVLALSITGPTSVHFSSSGKVRLWKVESPDGKSVDLTHLLDLSSPNRQRVPLNEGLYAVASPPGAGLAIEGGVVILPSGGEDPWPVPPSKQLVQQLRSLISAEFEKLKQRPL